MTVELSWNSTSILPTGFNIYRSSTHFTDKNNAELAATLPKDATSWVDETAQEGDYWYRIGAFMGNGYEVLSDAFLSTPLYTIIHDIFNDGSIVATWTLNGDGDDLGGNYPITFGQYTFTDSVSMEGMSYLFDSSVEHYLMRNGNDIPTGLDGSMSLSFWIYPFDEVINRSYAGVFSLGSSTDYTIFEITFNSGGYIYPYLPSSTYSKTTITPNQWYHIGFSFDGNTGDFVMYLNGEVESTGSTTDRFDSSGYSILFGHEPDSGNPYGGFDAGQSFAGHFDQIRAFDRVISREEFMNIITFEGVII